jgi:nonsense-mediated mRNA decay protein 3
MARFCPVCGDEEKEQVEGLCERCFWEDALEDFPKSYQLNACNSCFSHLQGKRWIRGRGNTDDEKIIEGAKQHVVRSLRPPTGMELGEVEGEITGRTRTGLPKTVLLRIGLLHRASGSRRQRDIQVDVDYRQCNDCYCLSSGKYEALVQIRAEGRKLDGEDSALVEIAMDQFFRRTESRGRSDISEIKEHEGGLDVKFVTVNMAKMFAKELSDSTGASLVESSKIMGIDKSSGGQRFRTTIALKMPVIRRGELIVMGGEALRVRGYHRGRVVVEVLSEPGRTRSLADSQLEGSRRIMPEDIKRVRMDALSGNFGTFLDMDEKRFFELPSDIIPPGMEHGETGLLISLDGRQRLYKISEVQWGANEHRGIRAGN